MPKKTARSRLASTFTRKGGKFAQTEIYTLRDEFFGLPDSEDLSGEALRERLPVLEEWQSICEEVNDDVDEDYLDISVNPDSLKQMSGITWNSAARTEVILPKSKARAC